MSPQNHLERLADSHAQPVPQSNGIRVSEDGNWHGFCLSQGANEQTWKSQKQPPFSSTLEATHALVWCPHLSWLSLASWLHVEDKNLQVKRATSCSGFSESTFCGSGLLPWQLPAPKCSFGFRSACCQPCFFNEQKLTKSGWTHLCRRLVYCSSLCFLPCQLERWVRLTGATETLTFPPMLLKQKQLGQRKENK